MEPIHEWRARGTTLRAPDGDVFALSHGDATADTTPVLALHGFPTSSHDFCTAFSLVKNRRFITFDYVGFGLSDKPRDHGYSLFEYADLATMVLRHFGVKRVHVWGHDMGTSVAAELVARRERGLLPFEMQSLTLMNGSVHIELAHLTVGQRMLKTRLGPLFARLNNQAMFARQMKRIFGKPISDQDLEMMWELLARESGTERLPQTIKYTEDRYRFAKRWIGALVRFDLPSMIAWGKKDPVAVMEIADKLAGEIPGAERETWDALGHYPQVEEPETVMKTLAPFWERVEAGLGGPVSRR